MTSQVVGVATEVRQGEVWRVYRVAGVWVARCEGGFGCPGDWGRGVSDAGCVTCDGVNIVTVARREGVTCVWGGVWVVRGEVGCGCQGVWW